jgi:hypothetical protein
LKLASSAVWNGIPVDGGFDGWGLEGALEPPPPQAARTRNTLYRTALRFIT